MSVAENRNTIGVQSLNEFQRFLKAGFRLQREPVNQVDVDAVESDGASVFNHGTCHLVRLNTAHGLLHRGIEVLNAETKAAKAERSQCRQLLGRGHPRIDFHGNLGICCDTKTVGDAVIEFGHLLAIEIRRCAAAPMDLIHDSAVRCL